MTVSPSVSPLCIDEDVASAIPIDVPPSSAMADSKLSLVLVLGSKNKYPRVLPLAISRLLS